MAKLAQAVTTTYQFTLPQTTIWAIVSYTKSAAWGNLLTNFMSNPASCHQPKIRAVSDQPCNPA